MLKKWMLVFLLILSSSQTFAANPAVKKGASDSMSLHVGGSEKVNIDTSGNMEVTGTLSADDPTMDGHVATKSYVDDSISSNSSIDPVCTFTSSLFTGDLGGYAGGDAECVSEFGTGWEFGTIADAATTMAADGLGLNIWVKVGGGEQNNCSSFTTNGGTGNQMIGSTDGRFQTVSRNCSAYPAPLLCCKF